MAKPYIVAEGVDRGDLEAQAAKLIQQGYEAIGGISPGDRDGRLYQAFVLRHPPTSETVLREPEPNRKGRR